MLDGHGERTMYVDRGSNACLAIGDLTADVWQGVGWLHLTGYSFFDPAVRPVAQHLVAHADAHQIPWSIDPSSTAYLHEVGCDAFLAWTASASVALAMATGLTRHYDAAVVTCGPHGAVAATRSREIADVRASATSSVDTTGAGDAFVAGYLTARLAGATLTQCLAGGGALARQAVSCAGGRPP